MACRSSGTLFACTVSSVTWRCTAPMACSKMDVSAAGSRMASRKGVRKSFERRGSPLRCNDRRVSRARSAACVTGGKRCFAAWDRDTKSADTCRAAPEDAPAPPDAIVQGVSLCTGSSHANNARPFTELHGSAWDVTAGGICLPTCVGEETPNAGAC